MLCKKELKEQCPEAGSIRETVLGRRPAWRSVTKHAVKFDVTSETLIYEHTTGNPLVFASVTGENPMGTEVKVKAHLDRGRMTCRLRDSAEAIRWEDEVASGKSSRSARLAGPPGTWRLEISLEGASGNCAIRLADF
jgi:hypothetical protein